MAEFRWTGAIDNDPDTVGNWLTEDGSGGFVTATSLPVSGDSVEINQGNAQIVAADWGAVDLESFIIGPGFKGTVGGSGTAWTVTVSYSDDSYMQVSGMGQYYNFAAGANGVDRLIFDSSTATSLNLTDGDWAQVEAGRFGLLNALEDAIITTSFETAGAGATLAVCATDLPKLVSANGRVSCARDVANCYAEAGSFVTLKDDAQIVTQVRVAASGRYKHDSRGTVAFAEVLGNGAFEGGQYNFTVTNSKLWPGNQYKANTTVTVTETNPPQTVTLF